MPGVRAARSDIAEAIAQHQTYSPGHDWLKWLNGLRPQVTHAKLVAVKLEEAVRAKHIGLPKRKPMTIGTFRVRTHPGPRRAQDRPEVVTYSPSHRYPARRAR